MSCAPNTISVSFHLTHHCNLRCTYCYTGEKLHIPMSKETADKGVDFVLAEAKREGIKQVDVVFFGGEPLLEKDLLFYVADRFIQEKEDLGVSFKMSTNGLLLTDAVLSELMKRKVFISLSIDGTPEIQNTQRPDAGGNGSARKVEKAAYRLLKVNPCANVTCVLTPKSAAQVDESVDYIFDLGFRFITITLDYSATWERKHFDAFGPALKRLSKWYETKIKAQERFYLSCFDERIQTRTLKPIEAEERCMLGHRQFAIAPNGELYPCIQFVTTEGLPQFMIGHVNEGFSEQSRHYFLHHSEKEKEECSGCALNSRCSSWCACINYADTGSIEEASPVVCEYERMIMPIADKLANRLWKQRNRLFIHKQYNPLYPVIAHLEITNA